MADAHRVIVTGSRTWRQPEVIYDALNGILAAVSLPLVVVHGQCDPLDPETGRRIPWEKARRIAGAPDFLGADWHAHFWVSLTRAVSPEMRRRVREEPHPADWCPEGRFDRSAGFRRNAEMVALGAVEALAFLDLCAKPGCREPQPHPSHGGSHCATMAEQAGIPTRRVTA